MKRLAPLLNATLFLVGALLTCALGGAAGASLVADDETLVSPYFPLKVGTTWEYLSGGKKIVVKVAAQEQIDGQTCARLETEGAARVAEHLTVKDNGVYRVRSNAQDIKPPVLVLKWPALANGSGPDAKTPSDPASWTLDSSVQNFALKGKMTVSAEKLTVGKETYDTLRVKSSDLLMGGQTASMETWYAKGVGMVKQHFKLPAADYDVVLELTQFTLGK